ncbi:MAG: chemotaxis protein CheW [Heyndrickxia faecalis]|uniref:chemotaxis protein CheW n=1 Tax=Heyndrickxia TaxID=2837504 RepID=UPI0014596DB2|nr:MULTISPECIES: chemotaxis protein CheW [Heyndrickxia]NWN94666.1 chemotaxis protein CheW [Bacillus sp. (in: firmicutes)]MEC2222550.1 chemotaxis protein CheW [Weizmannia sp. CD-2023]MED4976189.1 chemotaxis protein CheW [Weizmannia sp. CD-2023]NMH84814.1 chemotaxis protein CheW [Heyndrickxia coagulans]UXC23681.1 chemotaxis protein CheW [Heyndrickxia coagulans]
MEKVIVFQLNDKEYALPVTQVLAIEKLQHITRVPLTAPFILGVMNLRGIIIPVIDLKKRFGMEDDTDADKEERKLIIVRFGEIETGLLVDEATDVLDIDEKKVEPEPEVVNAGKEDFISGVANINERLLLLLDLEKTLTPLQ